MSMTTVPPKSSSCYRLTDVSHLHIDLTLDAATLTVRILLSGSINAQQGRHSGVSSKDDSQVFLHWGITLAEKPAVWVAPDRQHPALRHLSWPESTDCVHGAAQTRFLPSTDDGFEVTFQFSDVNEEFLFEGPRSIEFVVHLPPSVWFKNGKANFTVPLGEFLQGAFSERALQDGAFEILGTRLSAAPDGLFEWKRWIVETAGGSFSLLSFIFCDDPEYCSLYFFTDTSHPLLIHWGLSQTNKGEWIAADVREVYSKNPLNELEGFQFSSRPFDQRALQTEFQFLKEEASLQFCRIVLGSPILLPFYKFVLKEVKSNNWAKHHGEDFVVEIPVNSEHTKKQQRYKENLEGQLRKEEERRRNEAALWETTLALLRSQRAEFEEASDVTFKSVVLSGGAGELDIGAKFNEETGLIDVTLRGCLLSPAILHWGVLSEAGERRRFVVPEWRCPPQAIRPPNTTLVDPLKSCETPFEVLKNEKTAKFLHELTIHVPATRRAHASSTDSGVEPEVGGIVFVLREAEGLQWWKSIENCDIVVRLTSAAGAWSGAHPELIERILAAEVGWNSMTLMHRYNLVNEEVSRWHANQTEDAKKGRPLRQSWTSIFDTGKFLDRQLSNLGRKEKGEKEQLEALNCNSEFWGWIFVWCRLSYMGLLDWQRNYNTRPRDLAHATECLSYRLGDLWCRWPEYRPLIRFTLSTIARGGSQGQAIRDRILDIMHRHRIPETAGNFYEQWHQKLHNNTTPDDIPICKATIQFLKSGGNLNEFWRILGEHGVTKERLGSYERKITQSPYMVHCDVGHLIRDLESYLDILKDVHDSLDLQKAFDHSSKYLPADVACSIRDAVMSAKVSGLSLRTDFSAAAAKCDTHSLHGRFLAVSDARRKLIYILTRPDIKPEVARELIFLDFAFEQQQALVLQSGSANFSAKELTEQLTEMVISLSGHHMVDEELNALAKDFVVLGGECASNRFGKSSVESALMLKALSDRVALVVGRLINDWQSWIGPKAEYLGQQIGIDQHVLNVFVDEVLRGSALFGISVVLKRLEPILRTAAQLPPWQIISPVEKVEGELQVIDKLINIQDKVFKIPTILLSGAVSGEEEIPSGVQAVLVKNAYESPDILSHVAVRARNAHVLVATCFEPKLADELANNQGRWVAITVKQGTLTFTKATPPSTDVLQRKSSKHLVGSFDRQKTQKDLVDDVALNGKKATRLDLETQSDVWVCLPNEFDRTTVGSKSLNLAKLRTALPKEVVIPHAVALPYGCFQKALGDSVNKTTILRDLVGCLSRLHEDTPNAIAAKVFEEARMFVGRMECPAELKSALRTAMEIADGGSLTGKGSENVLLRLYEKYGEAAAWKAIVEVWSSLFGLRPWISLSKAGRSFHELNMAVLVQELLPARYAFVLHSKNPFDKENTSQMYGELVPGLGEILVGNAPGRALSWTMQRGKSPTTTSFPSKLFYLVNPGCLIFRSDSNGEDLEGFAGAGLFESIPTEENRRLPLAASTDRLIVETEYRRDLLRRIGDLAFAIEDFFCVPMDIEGVVLEGDALGVVQARPQV